MFSDKIKILIRKISLTVASVIVIMLITIGIIEKINEAIDRKEICAEKEKSFEEVIIEIDEYFRAMEHDSTLYFDYGIYDNKLNSLITNLNNIGDYYIKSDVWLEHIENHDYCADTRRLLLISMESYINQIDFVERVSLVYRLNRIMKSEDEDFYIRANALHILCVNSEVYENQNNWRLDRKTLVKYMKLMLDEADSRSKFSFCADTIADADAEFVVELLSSYVTHPEFYEDYKVIEACNAVIANANIQTDKKLNDEDYSYSEAQYNVMELSTTAIACCKKYNSNINGSH